MEEQQINEARLDIRTRGFWVSDQQAFFGIRVFDPNACRYLNKSLQQCYVMNEFEKKRSCNERVLQVDQEPGADPGLILWCCKILQRKN